MSETKIVLALLNLGLLVISTMWFVTAVVCCAVHSYGWAAGCLFMSWLFWPKGGDDDDAS
jgi:hypothetical protein